MLYIYLQKKKKKRTFTPLRTAQLKMKGQRRRGRMDVRAEGDGGRCAPRVVARRDCRTRTRFWNVLEQTDSPLHPCVQDA